MKMIRKLVFAAIAAMTLPFVAVAQNQLASQLTVQTWVRNANGSAGTPSYSFTNDSNSGWYSVADNQIGLSINGTRSLTYSADGTITGASTQTLAMPSTGGITMTPSGTGFASTSGGFRVTGAPTFSGATGLEVNVESDIVTLRGYSRATSAYKRMRFDAQSYGLYTSGTGDGNIAIEITTGNSSLFGTRTDSANGRIQIATHTTSAGGIGFGTAVSLHTTAVAGALSITHTGTNPALYFTEGSVLAATFQTSVGDLFITTSTAKSIFIRTNTTVALTIDSSQRSEFAASVSILGAAAQTGANRTVIGNSTGTAQIVGRGIDASTNGALSLISTRSDGTNVVNVAALTITNVTFPGTITKPGGTSPLITTNTAITSGAGVALGTLTNAPIAGDPTKWVAVNDNGTTRYAPLW